MKSHNSKLTIEKNKKNQNGLFKKKYIFLFFLSFFIGFLGIFLLFKKFSWLKFEKQEQNKKNEISYSFGKIKDLLHYYLNIYYDPLDLIEYLKRPTEEILLIDARDKVSFEKEHIKTAILFENVDQIKKIYQNEKKTVILYGNYQNDKKTYQIAYDLLNQGIKVKILSIGYNQFRHLKIYWLPQSILDKINIEDFIEFKDN